MYHEENTEKDYVEFPSLDFKRQITYAEDSEEEKDDWELSQELRRMIEQEDKGIKPHEEPIEVINLGTEEEVKEIKIGHS